MVHVSTVAQQIGGYEIKGLIHRTRRSTVYRALAPDGQPVVIKTPSQENPPLLEIARYQRAFDFAREADPRCVVRHISLLRYGGSVALVMEDGGEQTLSTLISAGTIRLTRWLEVGSELATRLGQLHASGVVHQDLKPANVMLSPVSGEVRLIDLSTALRWKGEALHLASPHLSEGTLAYKSPEQCGLTSNPIDHRSDLYSLGVMLFELASGRVPFDFETPAELAHAHVARRPPALSTLRKEFPGQVSDIVARLLAKNADDRYASAMGLAHDLGRCMTELRRTGTVRAFPLGEMDAAASFAIPNRLYGREADLARLTDAIAEARKGRRVFVTVAGFSGIGKSALVADIGRRLTLEGGRFCIGKHGEFGAELPYQGLLKAMHGLVRRELAEPPERLEKTRTSLQQALGLHGQLLTAALPELEAIVGQQPHVDDASPRDAERRLHRVFARFLAVFATREQPLLLFLDDLQWADSHSLNLVVSLAEAPNLDHLILVAGYRSNEVGLGHPLREVLQRLRSASAVPVDVELTPILTSDVAQMLADTLRADRHDVGALAAHIHAVAAGNPFFVREFMKALHERHFFQYNEDTRAWVWDLARLPAVTLPDNVAGLVAQRLQGLPASCLDLLHTSSCVGSDFDLRTLCSVHGVPASAIAVSLAPAVQEGVIVPLDTRHQVFESLAGWSVPDADSAALGTAWYRFQHDRVRRSVHESLDPDRRSERHLRIGRLLIQTLPPDELERRVVEVFMHVMDGAHLISEAEERHRMAVLGLTAGRRVERGLAFETAQCIFRAASALMLPAAWERDYATAIGIHLGLSRSAYALGREDDFAEATAQVVAHARTVVHLADANSLRIRMMHIRARYVEAVDIGVSVAASLGMRLPRKPTTAHVLLGVARTLAQQRGRDPLTFAEIGASTSEEVRAATTLLSCIAEPVYFAEPNLMPLIGMAFTQLSLRHGMTPWSAYGFAVWALVLCGGLGLIESGYRFGLLALEIGRRYGGAEEARARFVVNTFITHWKEPLTDVTLKLQSDWAGNRDSGNAVDATYCAGVMFYTHYLAGGSLDVLERYPEEIRYVADGDLTHVKDCFLAWVELCSALRQPDLPEELEGRWFSYPGLLPRFQAADNRVQIAISSMAAGVLDHFAGRHERAEQRFALAARWEENIVGQVLVPGLAFFRALNALRCLSSQPAGAARRSLLSVARKQRSRLARWAKFAPFNLDHRTALLDAEFAILRRKPAEAMLLLHRAIEQAGGGAPMYQALAQQRLAELHQTQSTTIAAAAAARQASASWLRWGASGLAARSSPVEDGAAPAYGSSSGDGGLAESDIQALCTAMATISSEIDEQALLARLMPIIMQGAGADRGLLLLLDPDGLPWVEIEASLNETSSRRQALEGYVAVSRRCVDSALRLPEPVLVPDAMTAELLQGEDYARDTGVAAILAAPIAVRGRPIGVIYLENHVARGAFTPKRVQVTQALGAQAGIALENARLYGRMKAALAAQTQLTEANRRFVPHQFLSGLGVDSIVDVQLSEAVEREMHVLFVDLRGFTATSIALGPRATITMINRYLSHVQPGIAAHGGFVGQYYGDGVLALFPGEADDALHGAVAMSRGLEGYNRERGDAFPELRFGMGLHSGRLTLGTIGDADHFQCSAVGESVNLAARMEELCKQYGATLIVSGASYAGLRAPARFGLRPLGRASVAGSPAPMEIYECLACYPDGVFERIVSTLSLWQEGLEAHQAGAWLTAMRAFEACVAACAEDIVADRFARRCAVHIAQCERAG